MFMLENHQIVYKLSLYFSGKSFNSVHQLKLMDSKCKFLDNPDEQTAATSPLIFFGPLTRTPMLDSSISISISAHVLKM